MLGRERHVELVAIRGLHRRVVNPTEARTHLMTVVVVDELVGILQRILRVAHPQVGLRQRGKAGIVVEVVAGQTIVGAAIVVLEVQGVVDQFVLRSKQVADNELHGLTNSLLRHHIGSILRDIGHAGGVVVHGRSTGEEAHQVEVQEGTKTQGLAFVVVVVLAGEHVLIGFLDVPQKDVGIGNARVGARPDGLDGALRAPLCVVEIVGIAPFAIRVYVVAVRQHLHKAYSHVLSVHAAFRHSGVDACQLILVAALAVEVVLLLDLRLRFYVEPVVAGGEEQDTSNQEQDTRNSLYLIIYHSNHKSVNR